MSPIPLPCENDDCPVASHATTGWCLATTRAPVLVVTTVPCPGDPADTTVTLIDPSTGDVVPSQDVIQCGTAGFDLNLLCDFDETTGEFIATFVQIFVFDPETGEYTVTLVRSDDPETVYAPVGEVRACITSDTQIDVEMTEVCYDDAGIQHGWQGWVFLDGVHTGANLYFDEQGVPLVAPTIVDCPEHSTEATLLAVLAGVESLDDNTDGLESCCAAGNALLEAIDGNTDELETLLTTLIGSVDGLEACCAASNALLTLIESNTDGVEGLLTTIDGTLTGIEANTNQVESLLTSGNASNHLEDDPAGSAFQGVAVLGVRNDNNAVTTSTDGDYTGVSTDSAGRVKISPVPAVERLVDGDDITGAGTITIPDGVLSFGVTVLTSGSGVTINGPNFAGPVVLFQGQSISHSADASNTLNGPITITTTAGSVVNAIWVKP